MKTDIFYVSCARDIDWFKLSLRSVQKNLTGFDKIHVVCEIADSPLFFPFKSEQIRVHVVPGWQYKGYLWQQWCKIKAPVFSKADRFFYIDSDTFVLEPCDVKNFSSEDGMLFWAKEPYSKVGDALCWKEPTEKATKMVCEYEYMRCFPFIVDRRTCKIAETFIEVHHRITLEHYIKRQDSFSEFNVLGRFADHSQRNIYTFVHPSELPADFSKVKQYWSHGPIPHNEISNCV